MPGGLHRLGGGIEMALVAVLLSMAFSATWSYCMSVASNSIQRAALLILLFTIMGFAVASMVCK